MASAKDKIVSRFALNFARNSVQLLRYEATNLSRQPLALALAWLIPEHFQLYNILLIKKY